MKRFFKILWASITLVFVFPFAPVKCIRIIKAKPISYDIEIEYQSSVDGVKHLLDKQNALDHLAFGKDSVTVSKKDNKLVLWARSTEDATILKMKITDRDIKDAVAEFDPWR